jgi:N-acetylmuramoyl-L-alanine amidase
MKRLLWATMILLAVLGALIGGPLSASAASPAYRMIPVTYKGKTILAGEAILIDSVTYVPFRSVCHALGDGTVRWDDATKTASYTSESLTILAPCYATYVEVNGIRIPCESGVKNRNALIHVPIRPIAEAFGIEVTWDPTYRIVLTDKETSEKTYDEEDLYWLSRIISAESKGEPMAGKIAVGNVVLNRVAHPYFPNSIKDVIFEEGQFTPVKNGTLYDTPTAESVEAAKRCLDGEVVTADALYFCNPAIATGTWMQKNCIYLMTVGNHAFYQ